VLNSTVLKLVPRHRLELFAHFLLDTSAAYSAIVEDLYQAGLIDKLKKNGYVAGLISSCSWPNKNSNGLAKTLLSHPRFLEEDVWLLFKYEGTAQNCLASADKLS